MCVLHDYTLARFGAAQVFEVYAAMKQQEVRPSAETNLLLVRACMEQGQKERALALNQEFEANGVR